MKAIKCKLILHGSYKEIHMTFFSISEAKQWIKECWDKPYTIIKLKKQTK
jgi:tRNA A37 threonylcarbamoyladenosine synthetase subunit TsaC/SUA5/YrdC